MAAVGQRAGSGAGTVTAAWAAGGEPGPALSRRTTSSNNNNGNPTSRRDGSGEDGAGSPEAGPTTRRGSKGARRRLSLPAVAPSKKYDHSHLNIRVLARGHRTPKDTQTHCMGCTKKFHTLRKRRHCRACGQVMCSSCTKYRIPLRMCHSCYDIAKNGEEEEDEEEEGGEPGTGLADALQAEIDQLKATVAALKETVVERERERDTARSSLAELRVVHKVVEAERDRARHDYARREAEIDLLKKKLSKAQRLAAKNRAACEAEKEALRARIESLRLELQAALSAHADEKAALLARLAALETGLTAAREAHAEEKADLLVRLAALEAGQTAEHSELLARLAALQRDLDAALADADTCRTEAQAEQARLQAIIDRLRARIAELEALLAEQQDEEEEEEEERGPQIEIKGKHDAIDSRLADALKELDPGKKISLVKIGRGLYTTQHGKKIAIRLVGKKVMVRVGGGYETLSQYLNSALARFFGHSSLNPEVVHSIKRTVKPSAVVRAEDIEIPDLVGGIDRVKLAAGTFASAESQQSLTCLEQLEKLEALWAEHDPEPCAGSVTLSNLADSRTLKDQGWELPLAGFIQAFDACGLSSNPEGSATTGASVVLRAEFGSFFRMALFTERTWRVVDEMPPEGPPLRIRRAEFRKALLRLGCPISRPTAKEEFSKLDVNDVGSLTHSELTTAIADMVHPNIPVLPPRKQPKRKRRRKKRSSLAAAVAAQSSDQSSVASEDGRERTSTPTGALDPAPKAAALPPGEPAAEKEAHASPAEEVIDEAEAPPADSKATEVVKGGEEGGSPRGENGPAPRTPLQGPSEPSPALRTAKGSASPARRPASISRASPEGIGPAEDPVVRSPRAATPSALTGSSEPPTPTRPTMEPDAPARPRSASLEDILASPNAAAGSGLLGPADESPTPTTLASSSPAAPPIEMPTAAPVPDSPRPANAADKVGAATKHSEVVPDVNRTTAPSQTRAEPDPAPETAETVVQDKASIVAAPTVPTPAAPEPVPEDSKPEAPTSASPTTPEALGDRKPAAPTPASSVVAAPAVPPGESDDDMDYFI